MTLCQICGKAEAREKCVSCGRMVCSDCFWTQIGVCVECAKADATDLAKDLKACGAVQVGTFTLTSGKESSYYIDVKKAVTEVRILKEIAERIAPYTSGSDKIAAIELGAVPIAVAVALHIDKPFLMVRKGRREHGTGRMFEGELHAGEKVIFVEDVTTTGGSLRRAIIGLREAGAIIEKAIVVVDREEGAAENLGEVGVSLIPLLRSSEILG